MTRSTCGRLVGAAMDPVGFALQLHDGRTVHDPIQQRHRQGSIAEVFGPGLEVDVGHQGRADPLAARIDDLVPQAGGLRTQAAFDAVETKFVDDQQLEAGIEADAVVDGLVGQGRGQIFQQIAAGGVKDAIAPRRKRPDRCSESAGFFPDRIGRRTPGSDGGG